MYRTNIYLVESSCQHIKVVQSLNWAEGDCWKRGFGRVKVQSFNVEEHGAPAELDKGPRGELV